MTKNLKNCENEDNKWFKFFVENYPFAGFCTQCNVVYERAVENFRETGNLSCFNCGYFRDEFFKED